MEIQCASCGKTFDRKPYYIQPGYKQYCSRECKYDGNRIKIIIHCENCGLEMTRPPFKIHKRVFCSTGCRNTKLAADKKPDIIRDEGKVLIPLSLDQWTMVDEEDYESIPILQTIWSSYWSKSSKTYYAVKGVNKRSNIYMHREILKVPNNLDADHKDFNGLNNSRSNIRICTRSQNLQNRRKIDSNGIGKCTSKYKGVSILDGRIYCVISGENRGRFETEESAALAYNKRAAELYGEFAHLNDI